MTNAAYMALVVMAWALASGVTLFLVSMALEIYEEHFHRW